MVISKKDLIEEITWCLERAFKDGRTQGIKDHGIKKPNRLARGRAYQKTKFVRDQISSLIINCDITT